MTKKKTHPTVTSPGTTSADPCLDDDAGTMAGGPLTSIAIRSDGSKLSHARPCRKVCSLRPAGTLTLTSNFLLKDDTESEEFALQYQFVLTSGIDTAWRGLRSSYYNDDSEELLVNVAEVKIRFNFTDLSTVTRLWLSLDGNV